MRLWHKDLIDVLPKRQLIAQWKECCNIVDRMQNGKRINNTLVNPIVNYTKSHFYLYCCMVCKEMYSRGYDVPEYSREKILSYVSDEEKQISDRIERDGTLFEGWHNERYLNQCYYILEEKFDRGIIPQNEWDLFRNKFLKLKM